MNTEGSTSSNSTVYPCSSSSSTSRAEKLCQLCHKRVAIKTDYVEGRVVNVCRWCANGSPVPIRRRGKLIGRNEPCPCGSGQKFKRCCGGKR